jgi:hypothetical protein
LSVLYKLWCSAHPTRDDRCSVLQQLNNYGRFSRLVLKLKENNPLKVKHIRMPNTESSIVRVPGTGQADNDPAGGGERGVVYIGKV